MRATLESLDDNKVKLSVEVDEDEFDVAVDRAFARIAKEIKVPGFRPGKAPRKLLEARLGTDVARDEALREELPAYYADALRDHEVDAIAAPEIEVTEGQEHGPVQFDAVVEVRPSATISGHGDLSVTIPSPTVGDEELQEQIDRLRQPFAELEPVERPAIEGDNLTVDIAGTQNDEVVDGLTTDDYLYEIGSGTFLPEFEENLTGVKVGDIVEFDAEHPDPDEDGLSFRILVKEVKEKVLPEVDDDWASDASEFDTVVELEADLTQRLGETRQAQAQMLLRQAAAESAAELIDIEVPEAMVTGELEHRLQDMMMRLEAQGMDLAQYIEATGGTQEQFLAEMREGAAQAARADLALRAVAEAEGIEVSDDELDAELDEIAERMGEDPGTVRETIQEGGSMAALRSDVTKRKALDWLVESVAIVDEDGQPIDRADLETPDPEDPDPDTQATAAEDAT